MKIQNPFGRLTVFEWILWTVSLAGVTASFLLSSGDVLSLIASLIGVTALIFVAKGMVLGQVLTVIFAVFYGIVSFHQQYYGEMITYLGMSAPIAVFSVVSWLRHPYKDSAEVEVHRMSVKECGIMALLAIAVTAAFYFILKALGNASLAVSTLSVTTSFVAAYLSFKRSPFYAVAYAANDTVLITLWIIASVQDFSYFPMVICFSIFFVQDAYGFFSWLRMQRRQKLS